MKNRSRILVFLIACLFAFGLSGCAGVKPYEREILADETMIFDPEPIEAGWHLHVREVTEGGRGGYSGTGGGCGCR